MYDDLLSISALSHYIFCKRRCALIHIEQLWIENMFTAEGRVMHDNAHDQRIENRKNVRIERGIPLRSFALGLTGKADVVEFHKEGRMWLPFPVEYKRGKPKADDCDTVQLCAQALCLEEMLSVEVRAGALFYGKTRRRHDVAFDAELRARTTETARQLHEFVARAETPQPDFRKKCESCSFFDACMPKVIGGRMVVEKYIAENTIEP